MCKRVTVVRVTRNTNKQVFYCYLHSTIQSRTKQANLFLQKDLYSLIQYAYIIIIYKHIE